MKLRLIATALILFLPSIFVEPARSQQEVCILDSSSNEIYCGRPLSDRELQRYRNSRRRYNRDYDRDYDRDRRRGESSLIGIGRRCVGTENGNSQNGTRLTLWECNGNRDQEWSLTSDGKLRGINGKCVGTDNGNSQNGTSLIVWECNGNRDQEWSFTSDGQLRGLNGKCVGTDNGNSQNGTRLMLWECNGNRDQRWSLRN